MSTKRRKFSALEKQRVALDAIKGELTLSEISSKYQVHVSQIHKWRKAALEHFATAFTDKQKSERQDHEQQLSELYQQIGRLKVENDFLKKKCDPVEY